ncbi:MAG: HAD-IIB family hydrolase [Candidatus Aminicenantes bacterium]|nr:HAD-IIB family hydrolase [Candidatus Aminicenantes bacterium]
MRTAAKTLLVFTDLDGTLLDAVTYSFDEARPALRALEKRRIPLIICSSKTRAEIEPLRRSLRNRHPFISENGGAVYVPHGTFSFDIPHAVDREGYEVLELGVPYAALRAFLSEFQAERPDRVRGFGDMSDEEVARLCGFSVERARLARQREFDEPILADDDAALSLLKQKAEASGWRIVSGGRFHHLLGPHDKGLAVRRLKEMFVRDQGPVRVIGLGDGPNDFPLLRESDIPVLLPAPDGAFEPGIDLPGLILAPGPGPAGWREAVFHLIGPEASGRD